MNEYPNTCRFEMKMEANEIDMTIGCSEFEDDFKTYLGKMEDVDISEQFIDENGIHERTVYLENINENDLKHPSKYNSSHNDSLRAKESLKIHREFSDSNIKQHKCHLCDCATNQKSTLKRHINAVHLNLKKHNWSNTTSCKMEQSNV